MFNNQEANISGFNMRIDRDYLHFRAEMSASDTETNTKDKIKLPLN